MFYSYSHRHELSDLLPLARERRRRSCGDECSAQTLFFTCPRFKQNSLWPDGTPVTLCSFPPRARISYRKLQLSVGTFPREKFLVVAREGRGRGTLADAAGHWPYGSWADGDPQRNGAVRCSADPPGSEWM